MQALLHPFLVQLGFILLKVVCLLVAIAYYTIAERKIMAAIQRRRGPNVVGFWGLLQPLADGLKLIAKEMVIPSHSNSRIFVAAPLVILTLSLISWSIIPFGCIDISEASYGTNTLFKTENYVSGTPSLIPELLVIAALVYFVLSEERPQDIVVKKSEIATEAAEVATKVAEAEDVINFSVGACGAVAIVLSVIVIGSFAGTASPILAVPGYFMQGGLQGYGLAVVVNKVSAFRAKRRIDAEQKKEKIRLAQEAIKADAAKKEEAARLAQEAKEILPSKPGASAELTSFEELTESSRVADVHYGVLVILALSSLTVYGLIIAGWASNSKYAFLGALRSAAQMISYEVAISLVLLPVILMSGSLNFAEIVNAQAITVWFVFPLLPIAIVFFISMIAETNRTPFDLPEAEAELVAGYNVEYSSIIFAMFFLAEYGNMIMMSLLKALLFLGGWSFWAPLPQALVLTLKGLIFCFLFVLVRATFPRYRYDQLMDIGWKIFLPLSTGYLLFVVGVLMYFEALPVVNELAGEIYNEV